VVDLSYQNESMKTGPIDVRISIELKTPSDEKTQTDYYNELFNIRKMLKDTVSIDVQGFFNNNNNFILKEIGIVFEKDPNLNNIYTRYS